MRFGLFLLLFFLYFPLANAQFKYGLAGGGWPGTMQVRGSVPLQWGNTENPWHLRIEPSFDRRQNQQLSLAFQSEQEFDDAIANYFSLSILAQYRWYFSDWGFYGLAGCTTSYGLSLEASSFMTQETIYLKEGFRHLNLREYEFALTSGFGLEKQLSGKPVIFVEWRYHLGLTDIFPASEEELFFGGGYLQLGILLR